MTINQRIQVVMDLIEAGIINIDQAVQMIDTGDMEAPAHLQMETVEISLP